MEKDKIELGVCFCTGVLCKNYYYFKRGKDLFRSHVQNNIKN